MTALLAASIAVVLATSAAAPAPGGALERRAEARARFEEAARAFDEGRIEAALQGFVAAYDEAPVPELLFNIGQCHVLLGRHDEAVQAFERYLAARPDGENAALARARLAEARTRLVGAPGRPPSAAPAGAAPSAEQAPAAALLDEDIDLAPDLLVPIGVTAAVVVGALVVGGVVLAAASDGAAMRGGSLGTVDWSKP